MKRFLCCLVNTAGTVLLKFFFLTDILEGIGFVDSRVSPFISTKTHSFVQEPCIKLGRAGTRRGLDIGTRVSETVCDLRTRHEGLGDIKYGTRGRLGWRRRTSNTGTHGTRMWMIIEKVGGKCDVSHFSREYVLVKAAHCSTLVYSYGSVTREFLHVCLGKNHLHWRKWNRCSGITDDGILEP